MSRLHPFFRRRTLVEGTQRKLPYRRMAPATAAAAEEAAPKRVVPWHAKTIDECVKELGVAVPAADLVKAGLSSAEAAERLRTYGPNKMSEKEHVTLLQRIWKQVANVLVAILVFVAVVSAVRAATSTTVQNIVSNWLQVALIVFVITYVCAARVHGCASIG